MVVDGLEPATSDISTISKFSMSLIILGTRDIVGLNIPVFDNRDAVVVPGVGLSVFTAAAVANKSRPLVVLSVGENSGRVGCIPVATDCVP